VSAEVKHHREFQSEIDKIRRSQLVSGGPTPPLPPLSQSADAAATTAGETHNSASLSTANPLSSSSSPSNLTTSDSSARLGSAARRASPLRDTIDKLDMILNEIPQMERKVPSPVHHFAV
jgi:hypothetical protein